MDWTDYYEDDGSVSIATALDGAAVVNLYSPGAYGYLKVSDKVQVEFDHYATVAECKAAIEDVARKLGVAK